MAFKRRKVFNQKRKIRSEMTDDDRRSLLRRVGYGGNPEHKRNPGDFGLTPPAQPRPDKALCDEIELFSQAEALRLLKEGIRRGLVSEQVVGDVPQNVWSITANGWALEAQLENRELATYHGYPMPLADPMASIVRRAWEDAKAIDDE